MKEIRVNELILDNFRTISKKITFGDETEIYGLNKAGKTTVYNAFLWLLTGYDNEDLQNHKLFDTRVEQTADNAVQCSVEGKLLIGGKETTIKRTADIKWVNDRKSGEKVRGGSDTYKVYIDGIEYSTSEFKDYINQNIADDRLFRVMLNGYSFLNEKWSVQRNLLISLFEDEINEKLKEKHSDILNMISKLLNRDKFDKYVKDSKSIAKKTIDEMDSKIDELNNQMEEVDDSIEKELKNLEWKKNKDKVTLAELKQTRDGGLTGLTSVKDAYLNEMRKYDAANEENKKVLRNEIDKYKQEYDVQLSAYNNALKDKEYIQDSINRKTVVLESIMEERNKNGLEYKRISEEQFTSEFCLYCNQPLPKDKIEELRTAFLAKKNKKIDDIIAKGKKDKEEYSALEADINSLKEKAKVELVEPSMPAKVTKIITTLNKDVAQFKETEEGKKLIEQYKNTFDKRDTSSDSKIVELENKIDGYSSSILALSSSIGAKERNNKRLADIEDRKAKKNIFVTQRLKAEEAEMKAKEYDNDKAKLMQSKINSVFDFCSIVLQKQRKDGTWDETCEVAYDGDYSVLNDGGRIIASIDIQNAFQKLNNVSLPLFVDRSESLTTDFKHNGQIVRLKTTNDKGLNVKIVK